MALADSLDSLKNFDVNDLDINNVGVWPGPIKAIVLLFIFGIVVGGGYYFLVQDLYLQLDSVAAKEADLKQQYETKAFKVANLDAYKLQMVEMEKTFGALIKQLPSDTEVPGLLEDITNAAVSAGLSLQVIQLQPEIAKDFYVELPINITVRGSYHELAAFVSSVAALPRIVTLHNFSIRPLTEGRLEMSIVARTYRYRAGG